MAALKEDRLVMEKTEGGGNSNAGPFNETAVLVGVCRRIHMMKVICY